MARLSRMVMAVAMLGLAAAVHAGEPAAPATPAAPAPPAARPVLPQDARFEALKALAGEWEGKARHDGAEMEGVTRASIKVVSAGSAVMLVTDAGTAHEMVTMFHQDDGALLATHYCAAMNQPRLRARAGTDASAIAFEFQDGTNLKAHPGRMQGLVMAMPGEGRHLQSWTYAEGAKTSTSIFDMKRVAAR